MCYGFGTRKPQSCALFFYTSSITAGIGDRKTEERTHGWTDRRGS